MDTGRNTQLAQLSSSMCCPQPSRNSCVFNNYMFLFTVGGQLAQLHTCSFVLHEIRLMLSLSKHKTVFLIHHLNNELQLLRTLNTFSVCIFLYIADCERGFVTSRVVNISG